MLRDQLFGYKLVSFTEILDIPYSTYRDIETGRTKINEDVLLKLHEIFAVNINWLLTGRGAMFSNERINEMKSDLAPDSSHGDINNVAVIKQNIHRCMEHAPLEHKLINQKRVSQIENMFNDIDRLSLLAAFSPVINKDTISRSFCRKFRVNHSSELPEYLWQEAFRFLDETFDNILEKGLRSRAKTQFALIINKELDHIIKCALMWSDNEFESYLEENYQVTSIIDLSSNQLFELYKALKALACDHTK